MIFNKHNHENKPERLYIAARLLVVRNQDGVPKKGSFSSFKRFVSIVLSKTWEHVCNINITDPF